MMTKKINFKENSSYKLCKNTSNYKRRAFEGSTLIDQPLVSQKIQEMMCIYYHEMVFDP